MFFNILEVNHHYEYRKDDESFGMVFKLSPKDDNYINIGTEHVVAEPNQRRFIKDREFVAVSVSFRDLGVMAESDYVKKVLESDNEAIGTVTFYKDQDAMQYDVWLPTNAYKHLADQIQNKNFPSMISIDTDKLEYGGGGGDCMLWNINTTDTKKPRLTINEAIIYYKPLQTAEFDIMVADVARENEQGEKASLIAKGFVMPDTSPPDFKGVINKTHSLLNKMYSLLVVVVVLLVVIAFKL